MELKAVLTIAGSDSIGGAGIQADIKTMLANGVYAMSAVTALTAQNTRGVTAIMNASPEFLAAEIDAVFDDIRPAAVKIGMVSAAALIKVIAGRLRAHKAENIVVDPVMVATSGARLLDENARGSLTAELFPFAALITPNLPELELLTGAAITSREERIDAARKLAAKWGCAVLSKGGHAEKSADDILVTGGETTVFPGARINTKNTHGTGCTLSSAIAANLAKGASLTAAIRQAKDYIAGALAADLKMGKGHGPLHHGFDLKSRFLAPFPPGEGK